MWFISINRLLKILLNNVRNQYENFFFHVKPKVVTFPLLVSLFFLLLSPQPSWDSSTYQQGLFFLHVYTWPREGTRLWIQLSIITNLQASDIFGLHINLFSMSWHQRLHPTSAHLHIPHPHPRKNNVSSLKGIYNLSKINLKSTRWSFESFGIRSWISM